MRFLCYAMVYIVKDKHSATILDKDYIELTKKVIKNVKKQYA